MAKRVEQRTSVVIRFAGDSGDGMQLTGGRFTSETALSGNDLSTLPDFPAEIRAPAGSLPGVSGFQLHFADHDILTPGDRPDVLVAMNPAALKANLSDLPKGATVIVDTDAFTQRNLQKAAYETNPLEDETLDAYHVHPVPLTSLTVGALAEIDGVTPREAERAKNMFALGLMSWLYGRETQSTIDFLQSKFSKRPELAEANVKAFTTGYHFGETSEAFAIQYEVRPAKLPPGTYRQITGNSALSYGLVAASAAQRPRPLPRRVPDHAGVVDPRGARAAQVVRRAHIPGGGRDRRRRRRARCRLRRRDRRDGSAGPGIVLKSETVGLAVTLELPLLIVDVQRAGPSTGMPTKPEQGDLLLVLFGRNSDSPGAGDRRGDAGRLLHAAIEAARVALTYRTPVYLLATPTSPTAPSRGGSPRSARSRRSRWSSRKPTARTFLPYARDPKTLARPWAIPGTPGLEHRIGGLEKANETGNVSYDPDNHDLMMQLRAQKVRRDRRARPRGRPPGERGPPRPLVGRDLRARRRRGQARARVGARLAHAHLRWLNPFPSNLGDVCAATTGCSCRR